MALAGLFEPITPPRSSETKFAYEYLKDIHSQNDSEQNRLKLIQPTLPNKENKKVLVNETPYSPPQSTLNSHNLRQDTQDGNMEVALVQFINSHDRAEVSYNAAVIDMRCDTYHDLIRSIYEAACPQSGTRWGIVRIDILWELPVSMTTVESGNFRETSLRGMQGPALRNTLRLMKERGWRDIFVVRYIEG